MRTVLFLAALCIVFGFIAVDGRRLETKSHAGSSVNDIVNIVSTSDCSKLAFADRGKASKSYLSGVALTFAKAVCNPTRSDVVFVGNPKLGTNDALSWYGTILKNALGVYPTTGGMDVVRQLYTLLIGLGMRESSGMWCTGRDMSAKFSSASSAEAGLFQTSYGSSRSSSFMLSLFYQYQKSQAGCISSIFKGTIKCSAANLKNWGLTTDVGYKWQALTKDCPAFATEWAAVLLRVSGGVKGEWGPLRTKKAQVLPACHTMLKQVQDLVTKDKSVCTQIP